MNSASGPLGRSPLHGVALYAASLLLFACLGTTMKVLTAHTPLLLVAWVRYAVPLLLMTALLAPTVGREVVSPLLVVLLSEPLLDAVGCSSPCSAPRQTPATRSCRAP